MGCAAGRHASSSARRISRSRKAGAGELEGRIESLRRTAAGLRATIAIDGYGQTLELDEPLRARPALGERVPLSLSNARIFPVEGEEFRDVGEGI